MILRYILNILVLVFAFSCSNNSKNSIEGNKEFSSPESQYTEAMILFDEGRYEEAISVFKYIERIYPLSNEAIQSQIMAGFADYIRLDYESAIFKFNRIIKKYPSLKNIDYVYNMACNMGGMGFIENNKAECMLSVLINTNLLRAALKNNVNKLEQQVDSLEVVCDTLKTQNKVIEDYCFEVMSNYEDEISFLGHSLDKHNIHPDYSKFNK